MQSTYTKNYRAAKKAKETESEKLSKQIKEKAYMRNYRRRKKDNETKSERYARLEKQNAYTTKCRGKMNDNDSKEKLIESKRKTAIRNIVPIDTSLNDDLDKETFLSQFDSAKNGSIHLQKWAIKNMQDFHNSIKFKIYKCEACHEAWPLSAKGKTKTPYICSRYSRDKNDVKKFSSQNNMIPSQVPKEL